MRVDFEYVYGEVLGTRTRNHLACTCDPPKEEESLAKHFFRNILYVLMLGSFHRSETFPIAG